jgi:DNA modification methylase
MAPRLTDNEKRDVIKYLEAGKPLPEKYRFLLFEDAQEVELLWNGKTNEVTNVVLPFQVIEQIDEPRLNNEIGWANTFFDTSGRQITGWTNKLIWGDNKLILSSLKNGPLRKEIEAQGGLKLIYIDPPFDVGADFSMDIKIGEGADEETLTKKPSVIEEIAYRDTWGKGADSFIAMIYERLKLMHDLLAEDGCIYVHCDYRVSGYMRLVLDEIFGKDLFLNEIIWGYRIQGVSKNFYARKHQTIFFYAKETGRYLFKATQEQIRYEKPFIDTKLHPAQTERLTTKDMQLISKKLTKQEALPDRLKEKLFNQHYAEVYVRDVWDSDSTKPLISGSSEYLDYPTQKPQGLLERIINTSTNEGDLIADFFCGSGTTLSVAEKLGRKWIGSDLGKFSIHTSRKRLIKVQRELKEQGKDFRAFEILNVGKYERENYLSINHDLRSEEKARQAEQKETEFMQLILGAYKAEPIDSFVNILGKKRDRLVAIGPINTPVSSKLVDDVVTECEEKGLTKVDVLGFDYEMGIDFSEYRNRGVDVAFRVIPREVFDKKAVEKGQVKFYDVAFIEVNPIIKGRIDNKELSIELTDFSVFYNQDDPGEITEALRPGGTKVVVKNGQVVKISKDRESEIVSEEILTKKWSDWIDYWAVDFDFASRKEIVKVIDSGEEKEVWTGDYIFDNEWQAFRTKQNRNLELTSVAKLVTSGSYKIAVKVVDIFGNDTTKVINVEI